MTEIIEWFAAMPNILWLPILAVLADLGFGWLPDEFNKWPGILATAGKAMHEFGKELPVEYKDGTVTVNFKKKVDKNFVEVVKHIQRANRKILELEKRLE